MEVEELPNVLIDEMQNEITFEKPQTVPNPMEDMSMNMVSEQMSHDGDVAVRAVNYPIATSSKTKHNKVGTNIEKKEIQEFFRVLRPHLPRKSKSKAYKMLQNIANGIVIKSSFQQIRKKRPKKRPVRKEEMRQLKTKSLSIVRRNERRLCSSSDSTGSNTSCPHCGYSSSRIARC